MTFDAAVRIVAALAAVGLLAAPTLPRVVEVVRATIAAKRTETNVETVAGVSTQDLHVVLDLATRLKSAGLADGVVLCQQLIDVMLGNTQKAARK